MTIILVALLLSLSIHTETGRLSIYRPGDGHNSGELACGGRFTKDQIHIAHRKWWKYGCGRVVVVCSEQTSKCVRATVQDAGPFGVLRGPLRRCVKEGRWKVWVKPRPPKGWRWRGLTDLSWGLWLKLGRPGFLSKVTLYFMPRWLSESRSRSNG